MDQFASQVGGAPDRVFSAVKNRRRRRVLRLLLDRASAVDEEDLCVHLAAAERGTSLLEVTEEDVESLRAALVHNHLPKLEDAGLVDWDTEAGTVTTTDSPVFGDPKFERLVEIRAEAWDDILANLAHRRRRAVLSVLRDRTGAIQREALARSVVALESDGETDPETVEAVGVSLHHVHLPKLQQAGLVAYEVDTGAVSYRGHPALEEWLDARPRSPRVVVPAARGGEDVWSLDGRENVLARAHSLFERAEDELFIMATTDGLLEEACIERLGAATDRGVDVYFGSQTPEVRDLVRERIPEAVIWEPQMDWLNLPPNYERVGRLVFADRERIVLGTLGDETGTGGYEETAITGSGENNPLVALMRELLGSRLDHLDAQSESFRSEIPL